MGIEDWYDALGEEVPHYRRAAAREQVRLLNEQVDVEWSTEKEDEYLDEICKHIRHDRPDAAIDAAASEGMGLMAGYRVIAYLCATRRVDYEAEDESDDPNVRMAAEARDG